jgi:hypothetical protein
MSLPLEELYGEERRSVGHFEDDDVVNGWETIPDQEDDTKRITTLLGTAHTSNVTTPAPQADALMDWYALVIFEVISEKWVQKYGMKPWGPAHGSPYWADHLDFLAAPVQRNIRPWKLYLVRGTSVGGHGEEYDAGGLYPKDLTGTPGELLAAGKPIDLPRGAYVAMLVARAAAAATPYLGIDSLRENNGLSNYLRVNGQTMAAWIAASNPVSGTLAAFALNVGSGGQMVGPGGATSPAAAEDFHYAHIPSGSDYHDGFYVKPSQRVLIRVNQKMA